MPRHGHIGRRRFGANVVACLTESRRSLFFSFFSLSWFLSFCSLAWSWNSNSHWMASLCRRLSLLWCGGVRRGAGLVFWFQRALAVALLWFLSRFTIILKLSIVNVWDNLYAINFSASNSTSSTATTTTTEQQQSNNNNSSETKSADSFQQKVHERIH